MIRLLPETLINQIAAGEVIENPASVVKELVENALDAGARRIVIEIKGGGLQLIQISDDGCGMEREDALLCFQRHATSKIAAFEDLSVLSTMGFRGEALAAISAIAKVTLITSQGAVGIKVEVEGGNVISIEPCARSRGTTLEVRSLFYNVPARKKFQKSAQVCAAEITKCITLLSLGYPEVEFELKTQERTTYSVHPETFSSRAKKAIGEDFVASGFSVGHEGVTGFLGDPLQSRTNRSGQMIFLNKRLISSPMISFTVKEAYGTRIDPDKFPLFLLYLDVPSHAVDVNVHPQKKEVRFCDEQEIKRRVREAVLASFPQMTTPIESYSFKELPQRHHPFVFKEEPQEESLPFTCRPRALGCVSGYLLAEAASIGKGEGLLLLDMAAARRRVLFDALSGKIQRNWTAQHLLFPLALEFSTQEMEEIAAALPELEEMGLILRQGGKKEFFVDAIPPFLDEKDVRDLIIQAVHAKDVYSRALAAVSFARKQDVGVFDGIALLEKLLELPAPDKCPQGKPTMITLDKDALTKLFK